MLPACRCTGGAAQLIDVDARRRLCGSSISSRSSALVTGVSDTVARPAGV